MEGHCGYCHDIASMWCVNNNCDGHRKSVCKKCAIDLSCKCMDCGEVFLEEGELDE